MKNIYDVAIVGAGPGGIATSCEAVLFGIKKIIVFEKGNNHSNTIRKYFKDNKPVDKDWKGIHVDLIGNINFEGGTKESTLDLFDDSLEKHLIEAKFNTEVSHVKRVDDHFEVVVTSGESYLSKNVVIAIGKMGKPNMPSYKIPLTLKKQINHTIIECKGNEDVLVVGGGDSACEYAYFICKDNNVTFNYRKEVITRAHPNNVDNLMKSAEEGKIELRMGVDIEKIEDENGKIKAYFTDGKIKLFDRAIYALGGVTPKEFLLNCSVQLDGEDNIILDEKNKNDKGLYVAGDIAGSIGGSIALALNHGYNIVTDLKEKLAV
ncbi:NAD(P)-binding domain-containing protein [Candidatus Marinarcus aquaticus]|uniref:Cbb3-type cytochrome oxidase assembly protein CcoS n=1 Tax=Candidatus Marinarcus aquaticus TaxID=2044504 RepID=A0A4Q0XT24_9BACT|nr:NAD(P)-binding domain-containing protein [Candidatus Marinarcus aquaticus]RXJ57926.1 cbb3-type cytochrome oxidase assembly protein CcoS [Candidatus Marinarcus aquaticus]